MWSRFFIIKSYSTVNVLCWAQDRMMVTTDQLVGHFCYSNWASPRCCAEIFERVGGTGIYNQATLHPRRDKHFRATNGAPISIYIYNILEEEKVHSFCFNYFMYFQLPVPPSKLFFSTVLRQALSLSPLTSISEPEALSLLALVQKRALFRALSE